MDGYISNSSFGTSNVSGNSPFALQLDYHIVLQVENPTGSHNWIDDPEGVIRETGESAHYRISYSFSATEPDEFNNMTILVNFHEEFENITQINNVALPSGATYVSSLTNGGYFLQVELGSSIPPGQSVILDFIAVSNMKTGGPDGYLITTDATLSGEFFDQLDGSTTPLTLTTSGPTWTVKAENKHNYTKVVTSNGDISIPDSEAYLVTFTITDSYREGDYVYEGIGGWSSVSTRTIDTIPTISGVVPEVVWSNMAPYTVSGNQVIWETRPPTNYLTNPEELQYNLQLRVCYPKVQVDIAGGLSVMTNLTNRMDVEFNLVGGVFDVKSAEVTFDLRPVPVLIYGTDISYKYPVNFWVGKPYSGTALYYGDNFLTWEYSGQLSGSNTLFSPITGEPGYYLFAGLLPGSYQVRFPTSLPDSIFLTLQLQGSDPERSSAPNPITGLTEVILLGSGEDRRDIDAGYRSVDEPNLGVIGDYVWLDVNQNGIQDIGEPGIDGVLAKLFNSSRTLVASMTTVTDSSTGNKGYYKFDNLPADTYQVSFPPILPNGSTLVIPFAGSDDQINSKPDPITGFTTDIILLQGESRTDIDAGYNPSPIQSGGTITKIANKHEVVVREKIIFTITFYNKSDSTIVGLRIFDISDRAYFVYGDAICRINSLDASFTVDIDEKQLVFVVQEPVPVGALVTIELPAFPIKGTPAGKYYDYAYGQYGEIVTEQTPDVEIIVGERPVKPCRPCTSSGCKSCCRKCGYMVCKCRKGW